MYYVMYYIAHTEHHILYSICYMYKITQIYYAIHYIQIFLELGLSLSASRALLRVPSFEKGKTTEATILLGALGNTWLKALRKVQVFGRKSPLQRKVQMFSCIMHLI